MLTEGVKFLRTARESGLLSAVDQSFAYLGVPLDFQNSIKFRDPRIAFSCDVLQELPDTTSLPHPVGIVISSMADVGENVKIYQNVTIGWTLATEDPVAATIGDDVTIYAGAAIIGDVTVGDDAVVGANAVVLDDVAEGVTVAGVPAREVQPSDV
jgi:serine acetyltransferase